MVNRILIRIKVVQIIYSFIKGGKDMATAEKELFFSLEKAYDLYHYMLVLMIELTDLQRKRIETARAKHRPTKEELNPNMRFVDNRFIAALRSNQQLIDYTASQKLTWVNEPELLKSLLDLILASPSYEKYMSSEVDSFETDREFWRSTFKQIIFTSELLTDKLEDQSLYWNDDLHTIGTFVIKTIKRFELDSEVAPLLPMYNNEEDQEFAQTLFRKALLNKDKYIALIEESTKNWELDRIAFMDIVIMVVALAEITSFDSIPVKVSLNEYIEIAKFYSTQRSGRFVNGMLDGIVNKLRKSGQLVKI